MRVAKTLKELEDSVSGLDALEGLYNTLGLDERERLEYAGAGVRSGAQVILAAKRRKRNKVSRMGNT